MTMVAEMEFNSVFLIQLIILILQSEKTNIKLKVKARWKVLLNFTRVLRSYLKY